MTATLVRHQGSHPPFNALRLGNQTDCGPLWSVICHGPHGDVPGKAVDGQAWYPYGGKEELTRTFSYVCCNGVSLVENRGSAPRGCEHFRLGGQHDSGPLYSVLAVTQWGYIPGKALDGRNAWYGYGDREHCTNKFIWLTL